MDDLGMLGYPSILGNMRKPLYTFVTLGALRRFALGRMQKRGTMSVQELLGGWFLVSLDINRYGTCTTYKYFVNL